jgi:hypothetical protein
MSVRPLVDRQYLGQLAVVREPTGSVGRHRSVTLDGDSDAQYLAEVTPSMQASRGRLNDGGDSVDHAGNREA